MLLVLSGMTRVFLLLLHDDMRNKGSLEDGSLWGSELRKKIVHLGPESNPSAVVAATFGKMKNNLTMFVIVN